MKNKTEFLRSLLSGVCNKADNNFSGVGLILYRDFKELPVISMRLDNPYSDKVNLIDSLVEISKIENTHHDGFHLVNLEGQLTHVSQYFSPPIVSSITIPRTRLIGGRHIAALFGSCLKGVAATGIASSIREISVFSNGHEIFQEAVND